MDQDPVTVIGLLVGGYGALGSVILWLALWVRSLVKDVRELAEKNATAITANTATMAALKEVVDDLKQARRK